MAGGNAVSMNLVLLCLVFGSSFQPASCYILGWLTSVNCYFRVCCDDKWIIQNFDGLARDLNTRLHGQHIARKSILSHVIAHFKSPSPSKALALSFHGSPGVGKSHVARIIAENMYKEGLQSDFVHLFFATREFPHESQVEQYKDKLKNLIENGVKSCERAMFIFDEVDKVPPLLLDVLTPYLRRYNHVDGVDYRKAVFIFLSNTGGKIIEKIFTDNWRDRKNREDLKLSDFENEIISAALYDEKKGGLWHSGVINNHLITAFVPFLPLERRHIRQCIQDDLLAKKFYRLRHNIPQEVIDKVIEELKFVPDEEQILSSTGCKRVNDKVDYVMIDIDPQVVWNSIQGIRKGGRDET